MRRRGRPLVAAAVIGGTAHHMGKKGQQKRDAEADQNAQIADLQDQQAQQQYQQAPPEAAPAPVSDEDNMAKLTQLKSLLDQGVLTQAEFDFQKTKILQSM